MSTPTSRRARQSFPFLRPLTQIAPAKPQASATPPGHTDENLGPTTKGSIATAAYGARPRAKSLAAKESSRSTASAPPTSSVGGSPAGTAYASPANSRPSSRRSSFAPRRPSMSAREPTASRRGSMWSEFGDEVPTGSAELSDADKVAETRKAFSNVIKNLWDSGVGKITSEIWGSLGAGWKNGEILGVFSIDDIGLSRIEHARVVVLMDDLQLQLQELATGSLSLPEAVSALKSGSPASLATFLDTITVSPPHIAVLLRVLDTFSKLSLRVLPALTAHLESPASFTDALQGLINLVTFLAGSSTDLRRALGTGFELITEARSVLDNVTKAIISIVATLPAGTETITSIALHPDSSSAFLYSPEHTLAQLVEIRMHLSALLAQPSYIAAQSTFVTELHSMWKGLIGNARVARVTRGVERIWKDPSHGGIRAKIAVLLAGLDASLACELEAVTSETDEFRYAFTNLTYELAALLPEDIAFSYAPTGLAAASAPTAVTLRGMRIVIPAASYDITKRGLLGFTDSGSAAITVPFDLVISLGEQVSVSATITQGKKVGVELASEGSTSGALVGKVWNAWLGSVVKTRIAESIEERIEASFSAWLAPFFADSELTGTSVAHAVGSAAHLAVGSLAGGLHATSPPTHSARSTPAISRSGSVSSPAGGAMGPVGARAAFLASLRMSSTRGAGRDVLNTLENPFGGASTPGSAAGFGAFGDDDEGSVHSGTGHGGNGAGIGDWRSRRMSMAQSLTDLSRTDSTDLNIITHPPQAPTVSQLVLEDDAPVLLPSLISRRLSMAYTPAGEPSLDAYDSEYDPDSPLRTQFRSHASRSQSLAMADSLDDRSEVDGTTIEGILGSYGKREPAATTTTGHSHRGFADNTRAEGGVNLSMARVMMELQGDKENSAGAVEEPKPAHPTRSFSSVKARDEYVQPKAQGLSGRRKSMSEYLSEEAMADTTDTTAHPGSRRAPSFSAFDEPLPAEPRPSMSSTLDAISSMDVTLHENIATPPRSLSRQSSIDDAERRPFSRATRSRRSFVELSHVPSMSEIGVDEQITRDDTEVQAGGETATESLARSRSRRASAATEEAGLAQTGFKARTMSSWMSADAGVDATLVENIRNPPTVDQSFNSVAAMPHSLASRRSSMASASA